MGSDADVDEIPRLRDAPPVWAKIMVEEWRQRTAYGKLLYPYWFFISACQWSLVIAFTLLIKYIEAMGSTDEAIRNGLPDTHDDE